MDVLTLRIALETLLADLLGTYRLANGISTPAISVRDIGEGLQPNTTVSGLEVVIVREPELVPIRQYSKEHAFSRWTVYLVNWAGEVSLQEVANKLIWAYPGSDAVKINVPQGVGPRDQMRVELQTDPVRIEG